MSDKPEALRSLYEVTGDIKDINTVLIERAALERKDALLRRMVEAWNNPERGLADCYEVVSEIRKELQ